MSDRSGPLDPRLRQFGASLQARRDELGVTVEQLADSAGVGVRQITRVEAGRASPSLLWLLAVAAALNSRVAELVGDL